MKPISIRETIEVILIAIVLLFVASSAGAQVSNPTADSQAYFQWINAVTADSNPEALTAHLYAAGVFEREQEQVAVILRKFKDDEFGLEASYNALPSVKKGRNDDTDAFFAKQEVLIERTVAKLQLMGSFKRLDARVKHEAGNISTANMLTVEKHLMAKNVSMKMSTPQSNQMNPAYSLYFTAADGPNSLALTSSMFGQMGGFNNWNPANLIDGNYSTVGFSTDTTQAGQYFGINLPTAQDVNETQWCMSASGYAGQFNIYYGDGNGYTQVGLQTLFNPSGSGCNYQDWPDVGAHTQWMFYLTNTPGAGPSVTELHLFGPGAKIFATYSINGTTRCPQGCSSALHNGYVTNSLGSPYTGPQISATGYINAVNAQSSFLPVPTSSPVPVNGGGEVDCNIIEGPIQIPQPINNDWILAVTYQQNLNIACVSPDPDRPYCTEVTDRCLPNSVPPDFDPLEAVSGRLNIIVSPFFNGRDDCYRPHNSVIGTHWTCFIPNFPGWTVPRGTPTRRVCTNTDKGTVGDFPGPW